MKIMLTGAFNYTNNQIEYIQSIGFDVIYVPDEREKLQIDLTDIDAVVCNGLFLHNNIKDFKKLKYIQLTSAGYDRVPLEYIKSNNITLFNASGVYNTPMAEFAISGVLQILKCSRFFYNNQKNHIWNKNRNLQELTNKNVVIFGAGNIGSAVAKRFAAFDCNIIGIDKCSDNKTYFSKIFQLDQCDNLLKFADIIVLTLPLTEETKGFFNKEKFNIMKSSAIFVNIARGQLVCQEHLTSALQNGQIGGAVLDVFETEPLNDNSPLWDMENVIITPHNSFVGEQNNQRLFDVITKNLKNFIN